MKTYKSKISTGLLILLITVLGGPAVLSVIEHQWIALSILGLVIFFVANIFLNTTYKIVGDMLRIKCGIFYNQEIDINTIRKISETNDAISSPATSFDRLEILYNKFDSVLISPNEKLEFIEHIKTINPNVEVVLKKKTGLKAG